MARQTRQRRLTLDEQIEKQEQIVASAQTKLDTEKSKLDDLYAKRDESKQQALLSALESSGHTYDEIMEFLQS